MENLETQNLEMEIWEEEFLDDTYEEPKEAKQKKKTVRKVPRKVTYNWSAPVVSQLISLVEQRPQLWDAGDPNYKLPKTQAWEEVANEISDGVDWNEAKCKWMGLRVTFKTNVAKLRAKKSGQSCAESAPVVWRHFKEMQFLEAAEEAQSSQSTTSFLFPTFANDTDIGDQPLSPIPTVFGQRRKRTMQSRSSTPTSTPAPSNGSSFRELAAEVLAKLGNQTTDVNKSFGEYIAQECETLTPEQAEELRFRVHTTVGTYKAELRRAKSTVEVQEIPSEAREKSNS